MSRAWIALGGNQGDRSENFAQALRGLGTLGGVELVRGSPVYETPPMGPPGQDRYWNAVVEVQTSVSPPELLRHCLALENQLGRAREVRWGPRTIDLDILVYEGQEMDDPGLKLPHPGITQRAFVLRPLADLEPDLRIGGRTVLDYLADVSEVGMIRVKDSVLSCL